MVEGEISPKAARGVKEFPMSLLGEFPNQLSSYRVLCKGFLNEMANS